jgi:ribose transport system ATP-binding protein
MDASEAVRVESVAKAFGETQALANVSFTARSGEIHAIVGENGSGKSTLVKILSGVLAADSGQVNVHGSAPTSPGHARELGVATIFQEVMVAEEASVLDNLYIGSTTLTGQKVGLRDRRQQGSDLLLRLAGRPIDLDQEVGSLPLSLKHWIVIARALLTNPKVLILDESSAALDLEATGRLHRELIALRDRGVAVILVTHRIAELVTIAEQATVLRDGESVGELQGSEITESKLLDLMTPQTRSQASASTHGQALSQDEPIVLSARGIQIDPQSAAFDFDLRSGEIVGLIGLDGQGQDSFVRMLAGLRPPLRGQVIYCGGGEDRPVRDLADAEACGIVYVSGDRRREGIFPNLSIFENFAIDKYREQSGPAGFIRFAELRGLFDAEVRRFSIRLGESNNLITSLSGGNQQKVLISRAMARGPRIIILNDPARGVDLNTKRELYAELKAFADQGGAVVYMTSEIEELFGFAERVDTFRSGALIDSQPGQSITEKSMLAAMFGRGSVADLDADLAREGV